MARISAASNMRGPFSARARRIVFCVGADRPPPLRHPVPQLGEVVRSQVRDDARLAEPRDDQLGRLRAVLPAPHGQFARIEERLLVVQERVAESLDRHAFR
jgi:hypothetical protein